MFNVCNFYANRLCCLLAVNVLAQFMIFAAIVHLVLRFVYLKESHNETFRACDGIPGMLNGYSNVDILEAIINIGTGQATSHRKVTR